MEWFRASILQPAVEFLVLFPRPWRYCLACLLLALPFAFLPLSVIVRPLSYLCAGLLWLAAGLSRGFLALTVSSPSSRLIDWVDRSAEGLIQRCGAGVNRLKDLRKKPLNSFRLKKRYLLAIALLPLLVWSIRPVIRDITIGRTLDQGLVQAAAAEGWALTGVFAPLEEPVAEEPTPAPAAPTATPEVLDTIHVVQAGESVREIARRYGVSSTCIMRANDAQYPGQDWDVLGIGQQLLIPLSDPACKA